MKIACVVFLVCPLLFGLSGCGDNLEPESADVSKYEPGNLSAASLDSSVVGLRWSFSLSPGDTLLAGTIVQFGSFRDTVPGSGTAYTAVALPSGSVTFSLRALLRDGRQGDPVSIEWAPAKRFESIVLVEYDVSHVDSLSGLHCGTRTTNPYAIPLVQGNGGVTDLYLEGQAGAYLRLMSANRAVQSWKVSLISSVIDSAASLDFYRMTFPSQSTFTVSEMPIQHNRIYYVLVKGDNDGEGHCVRLHVRLLGGSFPNRQIQVTVSLQRIPGVPFAANDPGPGRTPVVADDQRS